MASAGLLKCSSLSWDPAEVLLIPDRALFCGARFQPHTACQEALQHWTAFSSLIAVFKSVFYRGKRKECSWYPLFGCQFLVWPSEFLLFLQASLQTLCFFRDFCLFGFAFKFKDHFVFCLPYLKLSVPGLLCDLFNSQFGVLSVAASVESPSVSHRLIRLVNQVVSHNIYYSLRFSCSFVCCVFFHCITSLPTQTFSMLCRTVWSMTTFPYVYSVPE